MSNILSLAIPRGVKIRYVLDGVKDDLARAINPAATEARIVAKAERRIAKLVYRGRGMAVNNERNFRSDRNA